MDSSMKSYLVISAIGKDQPGIVNALSVNILDAKCNIEDSRMSVLGGEFAIILLVSGESADIDQLDTSLPELQESLGLIITSKHTEQRHEPSDIRLYSAKALSIDQPGIVYQLAGFFSERDFNIETLSTDSYAAAHTGTPMFSVDLIVGIPTDIDIENLSDQFLSFCDELNIDASIISLDKENIH